MEAAKAATHYKLNNFNININLTPHSSYWKEAFSCRVWPGGKSRVRRQTIDSLQHQCLNSDEGIWTEQNRDQVGHEDQQDSRGDSSADWCAGMFTVSEAGGGNHSVEEEERYFGIGSSHEGSWTLKIKNEGNKIKRWPILCYLLRRPNSWKKLFFA